MKVMESGRSGDYELKLRDVEAAQSFLATLLAEPGRSLRWTSTRTLIPTVVPTSRPEDVRGSESRITFSDINVAQPRAPVCLDLRDVCTKEQFRLTRRYLVLHDTEAVTRIILPPCAKRAVKCLFDCELGVGLQNKFPFLEHIEVAANSKGKMDKLTSDDIDVIKEHFETYAMLKRPFEKDDSVKGVYLHISGKFPSWRQGAYDFDRCDTGSVMRDTCKDTLFLDEDSACPLPFGILFHRRQKPCRKCKCGAGNGNGVSGFRSGSGSESESESARPKSKSEVDLA